VWQGKPRQQWIQTSVAAVEAVAPTSDAAACGSTGNGKADVDAAGGTSLRVVYLRNRKGIE
jgi:hypothetical protein